MKILSDVEIPDDSVLRSPLWEGVRAAMKGRGNIVECEIMVFSRRGNND